MEIHEGSRAAVGAIDVVRVLPRRTRRTVGPWCFLDHMGPSTVSGAPGLGVGPHPHIGLQTVTWLLEGAVLHRDSLGTEQLIRPGQLNLMTAGRGVSHSEETAGYYDGALHGVQLWVALPEAGRAIEPAFEHHGELPVVEMGDARATVLMGTFAGATSPARRDGAIVGVELAMAPGRCEFALDPTFEHALTVVDGSHVVVDGADLAADRLAVFGPGRTSLSVQAGAPARLMLIGGPPRVDPIVMWWNYVAPSRDEIVEAHRQWTAEDARFGTVASPLPRVLVDGPPW